MIDLDLDLVPATRHLLGTLARVILCDSPHASFELSGGVLSVGLETSSDRGPHFAWSHRWKNETQSLARVPVGSLLVTVWCAAVRRVRYSKPTIGRFRFFAPKSVGDRMEKDSGLQKRADTKLI